MIERRNLFELALASLPAAVLAAQPGKPAASRAKVVAKHALPDVRTNGWSANIIEVNYGPGEESSSHKHAGFVVGYVLEGEIRFQLGGQPERTLRAGETFYEPPGSIHQVSGNASKTKPARILAMIFAESNATLTTPA